MREHNRSMTIRDKVAACGHMPADEVAAFLGLSPQYVKTLRWRIRHPERFKAKQRAYDRAYNQRTDFSRPDQGGARRAKAPWRVSGNDAILRQMWDGGERIVDIARKLGTTRNAVIGRAHRLGLAKRRQGNA